MIQRIALLVTLAIATTATAAPHSCGLSVLEICSPFATDRGACNDDSRRWVKAWRYGDCGTDEIAWEIRVDPSSQWPTHEAQIFNFGNAEDVGFAMGECGDYFVRATLPAAEAASSEILIHLPSPFCGDPE